MKILNFGSINIDKVYSVENIAKPSETIKSNNYEMFPGGKGLNQSIALARSGKTVYHAGAISVEDDFLFDYLVNNNIKIDYMFKKNTVSGHAIIQVDKKGQNSIIVCGGANYEITENMIDSVLSNFKKDDVLILQNEISNISYIVNEAKNKKMKIYLNPSPITKEIYKIPFEKIDCLIFNEIEGFLLTKEKQIEKILEKMSYNYPEMELVMTLGSKGVKAYSDGNYYFVEAYKVPVIDTTGAGDTFTGYYIASRSSGLDIKESLLIATKASAIAVTRPGAAPSIPHMNEISNFEI